jgi:cytochrome b
MTYQPGEFVRRYHHTTWGWVPATVTYVSQDGMGIRLVPGYVACPVLLYRLPAGWFSPDDVRPEGWFA